MRFFAPILAVAALASTVIADGAAVIASMKTISDNTIALNTTLTEWDGNLLGVVPITAKSTELLISVIQAGKVAEESENFTFAETVAIGGETQRLAVTVVQSLKTLQAAKPKFKKLLLTPVIRLNTIALRDATNKFSSTVVAKVPEVLQAYAKSLTVPIEDEFARAVNAYSGF